MFSLSGELAQGAAKPVEEASKPGSGMWPLLQKMMVKTVMKIKVRKEIATHKSVQLTVFCLNGSPMETAARSAEVVSSNGSGMLPP